jgi:pilus assembly protein CpaF
MFKQFGKGDKTAAGGNGNVVDLDAAAKVTSSALRSLTQNDKELTDRLDLKSRLHEALLDRLNLSVIDKVATFELRR